VHLEHTEHIEFMVYLSCSQARLNYVSCMQNTILVINIILPCMRRNTLASPICKSGIISYHKPEAFMTVNSLSAYFYHLNPLFAYYLSNTVRVLVQSFCEFFMTTWH
jgi:hypothetical protein